MNIYRNLNEMLKYIDNNLEENIDYNDLAKFLGINTYTMKRIFTMLAGLPLAEYIRKRRLSNAGFDLYLKKDRIIDIAIKYQYENATSFSRAFENFHGIKPSQVSKDTKLKNFPRITFNEEVMNVKELDYEIIELKEFNLYGVGIDTNNRNIGHDAPKFFQEIENKYKKKYGKIKYGMITYTHDRYECKKYYCLYDQKIEKFEYIKLPASKWLKFKIATQNEKDIQEISHRFYREFLPSCKFNLKEIPELEYYHDNKTDFLVAIY